MKWYQEATINGVEMPAQRQNDTSEKRWKEYIEPLIPMREGLFVDLGCNAGAYMRKAVGLGFQSVGIEKDPEYAEHALFWEKSDPLGVKIIRGNIDNYDLPACQIALLSKVHYWLTKPELDILINKLKNRALNVIVVGRHKMSDTHKSACDLNSLRKLFDSFTEGKLISGKKHYSVIFHNPRLVEKDVNEVFYNQPLVKSTKFLKSFNKLIDDGSDPFNSDYYEYLRWRKFKNAKEILSDHIDLIKDIRKHGIKEPLLLGRVVRGRYKKTILTDGDHRIIIAKKIGIKKIICKFMNTLDYIIKKFSLNADNPPPIEIPNVGRNDLPIWLHELDFKVGVEVGVAAGEYSEVIAKTNPQMKIYGVDIWKGYKEYKHYVKDEEFEKLFEKTQRRLSGYPNYKIIRELSMNALRFFDDNSLDFVYLDANHEDPFISEDIREWYKKLKNGGILAGHDYIRPGDSRRNKFDAQEKWDVIDAVNRYTKENNIRPWFILGSQGKIPGTVRDNSRSWMWVKSTAVLEDTGERQIPSIPGTLEGVDINHTQRYGWAAMFTTGKFVYDISCGTGYGSLLLGAKQYAGFDLSSETIEYAKNYYGKSQSVSFSVADACKMPENLGLADVIISFETIEHIKEPETFLKWCTDHGKILVLSSPIRGSFGRSRFHLTEYNLSELTNMLNKYFNNVRLFVQKDQKISFPCLPEDKGVVIAVCQHIKK